MGNIKSIFDVIGYIAAIAWVVMMLYVGGSMAEHESRPHAGAATNVALTSHTMLPHIDSRPLVQELRLMTNKNTSDIEANQKMSELIQKHNEAAFIGVNKKLDDQGELLNIILNEVRKQ